MSPLARKWPLGAAIILTVVAAGLVIPWFDWGKVFDALEQFRRRPAPVVAEVRATVLLVSTQEKDSYIVRYTVEPRGYALKVANSVDQAKKILDREGGQIAVVVVDTAVPGAKKLIQATKAVCPRAHLVELRGNREAGQVSAMLVSRVL
jgi:hypothetical protein